MKPENWVILFFCLSGCLFLVYFYKANMTERSEYLTERYSEYITTAGNEALLTATEGTEDRLLFSTNSQREKSIKTFYATLNTLMGLDNPINENLTQYYVPCMVMLDYDGFYIEYPVEYLNDEGSRCIKKVVTNIFTWTKKYNDYVVRFYLDDTVKITKANGLLYFEGTYKDFYEEADDYDKSMLSFMSSTEDYTKERSHVISLLMNDVLTEYINKHNSSLNVYDIDYMFSLPETFSMEAKNITSPCVIAFLQGVQARTDLDYINVYSIAGNELIKGKTYYGYTDAGGHKYYHESDCTALVNKEEGWGSMESMAKKGYYPCPECVLHAN